MTGVECQLHKFTRYFTIHTGTSADTIKAEIGKAIVAISAQGEGEIYHLVHSDGVSNTLFTRCLVIRLLIYSSEGARINMRTKRLDFEAVGGNCI